MASKPISEPLAIPRRIKEEGGDTGSSEDTVELASSFASASLRDGRPIYRPSSTSELQGSPPVGTPTGSYPARAASMGHAADVKRGLAMNRQRQAQARQQRAAGERIMKRTHSAPGLADDGSNHGELPKIIVGVCAMDRKARSKPMENICKRLLAFGEFELAIFGDDIILNKPVDEWPLCDALLSWHSEGFPLKKAQQYAALRKPYLINDILESNTLLDRRNVYRRLQESGIPVPNHIIVNRDENGQDPPGFEETEDYVSLNGTKISKPFVEKPADAENHNIHIYYPHSMGGGVKRLFRKVDNKSADYDADHPGTVRRDGSYIYEEFLATGGTDVKVYTIGPRYAHAEARKSPVVDGKVVRSADGKELRFPVLLSPQEKEIARMVTLAFGQKVCGFDLLRSERARSFVCDVNGWSFVKNSHKYYDDAAGILRSIILSAIAPHRLSMPHAPLPAFSVTPDQALPRPEDLVAGMAMAEHEGAVYEDSMDELAAAAESMELRCVLAVVRHGDRTPKQKMKMTVTQEPMLELMHKHMDVKGKQAKLKSPAELQELLDVTRELLKELDAQPSTPETDELREKFRIVKTVLEQGGQFAGINRKVQLKALRWSGPRDADPDAPKPRVTEALLILKHGGVLTHAGRAQSEELGRHFRTVMYPRYGPAGGGLLRLHSTYRHDLKIYSSDEGRVQMSAAAFTQGLLDLEGHSLTPILVSLVKKDAHMLDAFGKGASDDIRAAKEELYNQMTWDAAAGSSARARPMGGTPLPSPPPSPAPMPSRPATDHSSEEGAGASALVSHALAALATQDSLPSVLGDEPPASLAAQQLAKASETAAPAAAGNTAVNPTTPPTATGNLSTADGGVVEAEIRAGSRTGSGSLGSPVPTVTAPSAAGGGEAAPGEAKASAERPDILGMPAQPLELLKKLMGHIKVLVEGLRQMCLQERGAASAEARSSYSALTQATSEWEEVPGQPCGGERLLLMFDRWRKLGKAFYSEKRGVFDISKVPDIYDSAKYDSIHNRHLGLRFEELYETARVLANAVIPNEYGIDPSGKLRIGSKICAALLGKILADLGNMREESIATANVQEAPELSPFDAYPDTTHEITHSQPGSTDGSAPGPATPLREGKPPSGDASSLDALGSPKASGGPPVGSGSSDTSSVPPSAGFSTAATASSVGSGGAVTAAAPFSVVTAAREQEPRSTGGSDSPGKAYDPSGDGGRPAGESPRSPTSDSDDGTETMHRLCPTYATDINSPLRHVRTRIYFTSESHVHSLINVLRYCQLGKEAKGGGGKPLVSQQAQDALRETPELDYLTHIVMRLYENKQVPVDSPQRFLVDVQFSAGANYDPFSLDPLQPHVLPVLPRRPLHSGTLYQPDPDAEEEEGSCPTLADLETGLKPMATPAKASTYTYTMF